MRIQLAARLCGPNRPLWTPAKMLALWGERWFFGRFWRGRKWVWECRQVKTRAGLNTQPEQVRTDIHSTSASRPTLALAVKRALRFTAGRLSTRGGELHNRSCCREKYRNGSSRRLENAAGKVTPHILPSGNLRLPGCPPWVGSRNAYEPARAFGDRVP